MQRVSQETLSPLIFDIETTGLDPFESRVVAIGYRFNSEAGRVVIEEDEHELLKSFITTIMDRTYVLVGYNIQYFDIPFLTARLLKNGESISSNILRKFYRVDLMSVVQRYLRTNRKFCKLNKVCDFLGIDVEDSSSGADVPGMWAERDTTGIINHCDRDLEKTYELYKMLVSLCEHNLFVRYKKEIELRC